MRKVECLRDVIDNRTVMSLCVEFLKEKYTEFGTYLKCSTTENSSSGTTFFNYDVYFFFSYININYMYICHMIRKYRPI